MFENKDLDVNKSYSEIGKGNEQEKEYAFVRVLIFPLDDSGDGDSHWVKLEPAEDFKVDSKSF